MTLTLNNNLTNLAASQVGANQKVLGVVGESMVSGDNKDIAPVDAYLGNSLQDRGVFLKGISHSAAYSVNLVTLTENALDLISSFLQKGITTIATIGIISDDKAVILQKYIDEIRAQIDIIISSAEFDGKKLLAGGAKQVKVQVGVNAADSQTIKVRDIGNNKIYRTSIARAANEWLSDNYLKTTHYATKAQLDAGILNNENLIGNSAVGGFGVVTSGTGGPITTPQIAAAFVGARDSNSKLFSDALGFMIPEFVNYLRAQPGAPTLSIATANQIQATLDDLGTGGAALASLTPVLQDSVETKLATKEDRAVTLDVFQSALTNIRGEQARLRNQKTNLLESIDALRANVNITERTADSYIKTDYVLNAQKYSELLREIVASITALQAANKIPEAAQKMVDALAE